MRHGALQHDMRIDAHQRAVMIGITVAGAGPPGFDVAHHRTGIAADLVAGGDGHCVSHRDQAWTVAAAIQPA